jgi:hypothetical protein
MQLPKVVGQKNRMMPRGPSGAIIQWLSLASSTDVTASARPLSLQLQHCNSCIQTDAAFAIARLQQPGAHRNLHMRPDTLT